MDGRLADLIADMLAALVEDVRMLKEGHGLVGISGGGNGSGGIGGGNGSGNSGGEREYQCIACSLVHASNTCAPHAARPSGACTAAA